MGSEREIAMRKFLITAHGRFASGIKSSLDIIIGENENVSVIDAYVDGNKSIESELHEVVKNLRPEDELVIFSDLMGGSVTNQALRIALRENVHIVSGMNLPLLIDMIMAEADTPVSTIIENSIRVAREQVVYVNKLINKENSDD
jgi:mannose/fructose/sorbose-specific phosphotransferase system IIA component